MKLNKLFFLFFLGLASVGLMSCGDDDDDDNNDDAGLDPSDIPQGSLVFTLDGEEISFSIALATIVSESDVGGTGTAEILSLAGGGTDGSNVLSVVVLDEAGLEEESYVLIDEDSEDTATSGAIFTYSLFNSDFTSGTFFFSTNDGGGNVTITDLDRVNETVSGTFNGTIVRRELDGTGEEIASESAVITDGAFNQVAIF